MCDKLRKFHFMSHYHEVTSIEMRKSFVLMKFLQFLSNLPIASMRTFKKQAHLNYHSIVHMDGVNPLSDMCVI